MKTIIKLFLINLILFSKLSACTLCKADIPLIDVHTTVYNKTDNVNLKIEWKFNDEFLKKLDIYDTNKNKIFDKNEQLIIEEALVSYIKEHNYLTDIIYFHKNSSFDVDKRMEIKPKKSDLIFHDKTMTYAYEFDLDIKLKKDHKMYIGFFDMGGNFDFYLRDITLKDYEGYKRIEPRIIYGYIHFYEKGQKNEKEVKQEDLKKKSFDDKPNRLIKPSLKEDIPQDEDLSGFYGYLSKELNNIKTSLEELLEDIKQNNSFISYLWLLLFSFAYGVIHALGPGHGKSLVSAYFLNQNRSYLKAFYISSSIGIVHTFSAFILTLVIYYIVGLMFSNITTDIEMITRKISALIIIGIALYMIYTKIPKTPKVSKKAPLNFKATDNQSFIHTTNHSHSKELNCSCKACQTESNDLAVVLAAGIVPCPGTVTIFIFTMSLGIYFVGFLSAVFMSLGMSLVIFSAALLSIKIKKSSQQNKSLTKVLEYGSLVFILVLGVVLLIL